MRRTLLLVSITLFILISVIAGLVFYFKPKKIEQNENKNNEISQQGESTLKVTSTNGVVHEYQPIAVMEELALATSTSQVVAQNNLVEKNELAPEVTSIPVTPVKPAPVNTTNPAPAPTPIPVNTTKPEELAQPAPASPSVPIPVVVSKPLVPSIRDNNQPVFNKFNLMTPMTSSNIPASQPVDNGGSAQAAGVGAVGADQGDFSVYFISFPREIKPGGLSLIKWGVYTAAVINKPQVFEKTQLFWGHASVVNPSVSKYNSSATPLTGAITNQFYYDASKLPAGDYYFSAYAQINGKDYWSGEIKVKVL